MVRVSATIFVIALMATAGQLQAQGPRQQEPLGAPTAASNTDPDHALPQAYEPRRNPIPNRHEVEAREKLQELAKLSDEQLTAELHKWPRYQKMTFGERAKFLQRIQDIRDHRKNMAVNRARELNLNLNPEQQAAFEKSYWDKKIVAEKQLSAETEPRRKELDEQMNQQLLKEFGSAQTPAK